MNYRRPRRESTSLDITPLIDVVFQLIIFLVVTTTFSNAPGIKVDLPRSKSVDFVESREQLSVLVQSDGRLFMQGREIDKAELQRLLTERAKTDADATLILNGDTQANLGLVVELMDLSRRSGVSRIHLGAQPAGDQKEDP